MQHVKFYAWYMKVMLEVFGLEYVDIEENLNNWKAKKMLKKIATRDFTPFQMYKLYSNFEIMDTNMWLDLLFEQASNLIKDMANNNKHNEKSSITKPPNVAFASRTKNKKKWINLLMCIQSLVGKFLNPQ